MKLKNAAKYFDTLPVYDGYSGALLFKIQAATYMENNASGTTSARRIFSMAPEHTPPAHSVIMAMSELNLLGERNPDEWKGSIIRQAFWVKQVTDAFRYLTPGQAALGTTGVLAHGQKQYLRETINTQTESELDPMWDISLSASLEGTVKRGMFLLTGTTLFYVRSTYVDLDGFLTCQSDQLDEGPVSVTFTTASAGYNPITDSYPSVSVSTTGLAIEFNKAYVWQTQADFRGQSGDKTLFVSKSAVTPGVGQLLNVNTGESAGKWNVLNVVSSDDAWLLHIRRQ
jgi:hypothetical protein